MASTLNLLLKDFVDTFRLLLEEVRIKYYQSMASKELGKNLRLSSDWVAQYYGRILIKAAIDTFVVDIFVDLLSKAIQKQVSDIAYDSRNSMNGRKSFYRWVGCYRQQPNGALRDVIEVLNISPTLFPPETGWYVNPGFVVKKTGMVVIVNKASTPTLDKVDGWFYRYRRKNTSYTEDLRAGV